METKNIWLIGEKANYISRMLLCFSIFVFVTVFFNSCSSIKRRQAEQDRSIPLVVAPGATLPPQPTPEIVGPAEPYGPLPPSTPITYAENPDQIVLVLGPGLSSGYTYVGVLKALHKLKVPIRAIYASEVGALVSTLYLTQPNLNKFDWALLQVNERSLVKEKKLVSFDSPEEKLESTLEHLVGNIRVEDLRTKMIAPLEEVGSKSTVLADHGELKDIIRCTMSTNNGFKPCLRQSDGKKYRASNNKIGQLYQLARQQETYPILVVGAGVEVPLLLRRLIQEQHAYYIHVPLNKWDDLDFRKKNQAAFLGKQAIEQNEKAILNLIGREKP